MARHSLPLALAQRRLSCESLEQLAFHTSVQRNKLFSERDGGDQEVHAHYEPQPAVLPLGFIYFTTCIPPSPQSMVNVRSNRSATATREKLE